MKASELVGKSLNYAVARALGKRPHIFTYPITGIVHLSEEHNYSEDWAQGGPIIERERVTCFAVGYMHEARPWESSIDGEHPTSGPTPLVAAMRCFVASKLGDEIEIPEELK